MKQMLQKKTKQMIKYKAKGKSERARKNVLGIIMKQKMANIAKRNEKTKETKRKKEEKKFLEKFIWKKNVKILEENIINVDWDRLKCLSIQQTVSYLAHKPTLVRFISAITAAKNINFKRVSLKVKKP